MKKPEKNVFNIESVAKEYLLLKNEKSQIEKRLDELKSQIEPFLEQQPEKAFEVHNWKMTLVHSKREIFNLLKAKENMDGRVLKPYLKTSEFSQIRTVYVGKKAEKNPEKEGLPDPFSEAF